MDLTTLDRPVADLSSELMVADLATLDAALADVSAQLKRRKDTLHAVMSRRFEADARAQLAALKKDTGTATITTNAGEIKVEIPKEVEWDQERLTTALNGMNQDDARHYANITIKVDERKFSAAPPAVQAALRPARTVRAGKLKFSFKDKADG